MFTAGMTRETSPARTAADGDCANRSKGIAIETARTQASAAIPGDFVFIEDSSGKRNAIFLSYVRSERGSNKKESVLPGSPRHCKPSQEHACARKAEKRNTAERYRLTK
jgi:hypothetical protein